MVKQSGRTPRETRGTCHPSLTRGRGSHGAEEDRSKLSSAGPTWPVVVRVIFILVFVRTPSVILIIGSLSRDGCRRIWCAGTGGAGAATCVMRWKGLVDSAAAGAGGGGGAVLGADELSEA